jgi:outer membrane protein TolC
MLPNVGSGLSYNVSRASVSDQNTASSQSSGLFYSVSLSQPLYRWGTLAAAADSAKIQVSISQRNYAEAYRGLALSIRNQYLGLVAKKITWRNAAMAQDRAKFTLTLEEDKLKHGRISQADILMPRLALEDAKLLADRYAEDLAQSKHVFARMTGLPELTDEQIPDVIPAVTFNPGSADQQLQQFLSGGWENNLSIVVARDWTKVAALNYKQAKYRLYPMVNFNASVAQSNSTNASSTTVSQTGVFSQFVGVSANWTLFDGRATRAAQISARATQRFYERNLQSQTDAVMDQARALGKQVNFSYRAMGLAEIRNAQSENAVKQKQDEMKQGLTSQVVLDATLAILDNSRLILLSQRLDFLARCSEFSSLVSADPVLQFVPANLKSDVR